MTNFNKKFHDFGRDPFGDWAIIVIVSLTLAVALIILGVVSYFNLSAKLSGKGSTVPPIRATIDTKELERTLSKFNDKAVRRSSLMRAYSGIADPSI